MLWSTYKFSAEYLPLKMAENGGRIAGFRVCRNKADSKSRCSMKERRKLIMVEALNILTWAEKMSV